MPTHEISLDYNKSAVLVQPEVIVRVGDADSQVIQATLYDDGIPYTPTGELRIQIERRDGGLIITRTMTRVSNNVWRATLPGVACAWHGETRQAYVAEYRDGKVYATTSGFKLKILPGTTTAEAIKYFDEELQEIRELAGEAGSMITDAEEKRDAAEKKRETAEQARETAEQGRKEAETERASAESGRKSAEQTRESQEASRKSAEQTRESQEETRQSNESDRERAESERESAEQERSEAEQTRETAEEARETAEGKREAYVTQLKADVEAGELDGATFTPTVDDDGNISWENDKERPNPETKNIKGPQGDKGDIGEGLNVLGVYASLDEIKQHHESGDRAGDAYMGGKNYYVWNGQEWQDCGELQGAKGETGAVGPDGGYYTPSVSEEGILTWASSKEDMPPLPQSNIRGPAGEGAVDFATLEEIQKAEGYITSPPGTSLSNLFSVSISTDASGDECITNLKISITNKGEEDLAGITVRVTGTDYYNIDFDDKLADKILKEYKNSAVEALADIFGAESWTTGGERTGELSGGDWEQGKRGENAAIYIYHNGQLVWGGVLHKEYYESAKSYSWYYNMPGDPVEHEQIEKGVRPDQVAAMIESNLASQDDINEAALAIGGDGATGSIFINVELTDAYNIKIKNVSGKELSGLTVTLQPKDNEGHDQGDPVGVSPEIFGASGWQDGETRSGTAEKKGSEGEFTVKINGNVVCTAWYTDWDGWRSSVDYQVIPSENMPSIDKATRPDQVAQLVSQGVSTTIQTAREEIQNATEKCIKKRSYNDDILLASGETISQSSLFNTNLAALGEVIKLLMPPDDMTSLSWEEIHDLAAGAVAAPDAYAKWLGQEKVIEGTQFGDLTARLIGIKQDRTSSSGNGDVGFTFQIIKGFNIKKSMSDTYSSDTIRRYDRTVMCEWCDGDLKTELQDKLGVSLTRVAKNYYDDLNDLKNNSSPTYDYYYCFIPSMIELLGTHKTDTSAGGVERLGDYTYRDGLGSPYTNKEFPAYAYYEQNPDKANKIITDSAGKSQSNGILSYSTRTPRSDGNSGTYYEVFEYTGDIFTSGNISVDSDMIPNACFCF